MNPPPSDDDNFETIIGHDGKRVRILKDGRSVHVRFRDAQAARGQAYLPRDGRQPLTDQQRRDLLGCRPGFRTLDSDTYRERKAWARDAREIAEYEMVNAWRNPPKGLGRLADGNGGKFGSQGVEGDVCTVRDGGVNEGAPGHLRRVGGVLRCIADDEDDDSAFDDTAFNDAQMDAEQYRELVYQEYARSISSGQLEVIEREVLNQQVGQRRAALLRVANRRRPAR